jgi:hypothetical protein
VNYVSLKLNDIVSNIFYTDEKEKKAEEQAKANLQQTTKNVFGLSDNNNINSYNPYLNKDGDIFNPYVNYQKMLDSDNTSKTAKRYIAQATGLTPTVKPINVTNSSTSSENSNKMNESYATAKATPTASSTSSKSSTASSSSLPATYHPPALRGSGIPS